MTEWLLIIILGVYTQTSSGSSNLIQIGSDIKFERFVDQRSCVEASRVVVANKQMRSAECIEITKK